MTSSKSKSQNFLKNGVSPVTPVPDIVKGRHIFRMYAQFLQVDPDWAMANLPRKQRAYPTFDEFLEGLARREPRAEFQMDDLFRIF